jgi:hypothetical protein
MDKYVTKSKKIPLPQKRKATNRIYDSSSSSDPDEPALPSDKGAEEKNDSHRPVI